MTEHACSTARGERVCPRNFFPERIPVRNRMAPGDRRPRRAVKSVHRGTFSQHPYPPGHWPAIPVQVAKLAPIYQKSQGERQKPTAGP
jgi:hypothetical protein